MDSSAPSLIDRFMPRYDVRTRYSTQVHAPAVVTYDALLETDLLAPLAVRVLFALRVLPARLGRRPRQRSGPRTLKDLARGGALLGEDPGREIAFGVIGRFWALRERSHHPIVAEAFTAFAEPGVAKAVIAFTVAPADAARSVLSTETRVACTDAASRRRFRIYWTLIGPFSGVTRRAWLGAVRDAAERRARSGGTAAIRSPHATAAQGEGRGKTG